MQVERLILSDLLHSVVAFCRTSSHVETTRLFPLFAAYLWIYIDDDTLPDLLMNWYVLSSVLGRVVDAVVCRPSVLDSAFLQCLILCPVNGRNVYKEV